jgi:hypothetical protein
MSILTDFCVLLSSCFVGCFGYVKWWCEIKEKRKEREAKEKAEAELFKIRRRSSELFPLLVLSNAVFNSLIVPSDKPAERTFLHPFSSAPLTTMNHEAKADCDGEFIYLLVDNKGNDAHEVTVELDDQPAAFVEVEIDGRYSVAAIRYVYFQRYHGQKTDS